MDDKRELIMRAAEKLFVSRRFNEVTTDDIAREAAVGKGTIYRHFKDKDDLFFQTATSGFDSLCALLRSQSSSGDLRSDLVQACHCISGFFRRRRELFSMMQVEETRAIFGRGKLREQWQSKRRSVIDALGQMLARGVEAGSIRSDPPPHVLAAFLMGMLRTRVRDLSDEPESHRSDEAVVDLFLAGAGHQPSRRPGATAEPRRPRSERTRTAASPREVDQ